MNKNRLEAFSDGVFAIVITLLILNIKIPDVAYSDLPSALRTVLPSIAAYVLSFMVIGLYWAFHHLYVDRIKRVNGTILLFNSITLLLVSFMPFPTWLMGKYPFTTIPVFIYGLDLLATNLIGIATLYYLHKNPTLADDKLTHTFFRSQLPVFVWVNVPYIIAIGISFFYPMVSYFIFVVVLISVSLMLWRRLNLMARS